MAVQKISPKLIRKQNLATLWPIPYLNYLIPWISKKICKDKQDIMAYPRQGNWSIPSKCVIIQIGKFNGLVQKRRNAIADALGLRLSCINPSIIVPRKSNKLQRSLCRKPCTKCCLFALWYRLHLFTIQNEQAILLYKIILMVKFQYKTNKQYFYINLF